MTRPRFQRVLFLFPPTGRFCREDRCQSYFRFELVPSMRPPMEECEAAAGVRRGGAVSCLVDAPAEKMSEGETLTRVRSFAPDLVVITSTFASMDEDLAWAAKVKEVAPGSSIGVRGAPCYVYPERILRNAPAVDVCLRGDYEMVFEGIIRRGFETVEGVISRNRNGAGVPPPAARELDALPFPDRSILNESLYTVRGTRRPQATVHVQRGCPHPCTYCLVGAVSGARARHRSPGSVADEMHGLFERGLRHFYLRAETFTLDPKWARAVSEAVRSRCPGARWVTTTRVDAMDEETLRAMSEAGCYGISFGIDTGSRSIGRLIRKEPDLERTKEVMRWCDRYGVVSLGYFMLGFVWETRETLKETGRFVRCVRPDLLTFHFAFPYPGTEYHDQVSSSGSEVRTRRPQADPALDLEGLSRRSLRRYARLITMRHYTDPLVLLSLARKMPLLRR